MGASSPDYRSLAGGVKKWLADGDRTNGTGQGNQAGWAILAAIGHAGFGQFKLDFTGVNLAESDLLGQPGDYLRQPYFSGGAIRFAAVQLGGAEAIFQATRAFLMGMNRIDDILQQTRLAEMAYLIESGNQWIQAAGDKTDHGGPGNGLAHDCRVRQHNAHRH